ncbi:MAG: hypothetical protein Q7N95_09285 [Alphaproteobacteria bacterium]|nr:hypothetical protein [Alphaproteobacteria bacterium]
MCQSDSFVRVSGADVTRKIRGFLVIGFQQPDSFPFEFPAKPFFVLAVDTAFGILRRSRSARNPGWLTANGNTYQPSFFVLSMIRS